MLISIAQVWCCRVGATLLGLSLALACPAADETKADTKVERPARRARPASTTNEVAVIKTTAGVMVLEFWPDVAPRTVENFKALAKKGFYDGTVFHRVIKGFTIQGGDPLTKDPTQEAHWGEGGASNT